MGVLHARWVTLGCCPCSHGVARRLLLRCDLLDDRVACHELQDLGLARGLQNDERSAAAATRVCDCPGAGASLRKGRRCLQCQPTDAVCRDPADRTRTRRCHRAPGAPIRRLTDEGQRALTWAQRILAERDELLADVERMRGRLHVTARIGAIPTAPPASPLLSAQFLDSNPASSVRVETLPSREIVRRLVDFDIDAGLTYLDDDVPPRCRAIPLYREQYVLIAPADDPLMRQRTVAWSEVAGRRTCALTQEMRDRRMIDRNFAEQGVHAVPVIEADTRRRIVRAHQRPQTHHGGMHDLAAGLRHARGNAGPPDGRDCAESRGWPDRPQMTAAINHCPSPRKSRHGSRFQKHIERVTI